MQLKRTTPRNEEKGRKKTRRKGEQYHEWKRNTAKVMRTTHKEGKTTPRKGERSHEQKENNTTKGRATPQNDNNLTNRGNIVKFEASNEKQTLLLL